MFTVISNKQRNEIIDLLIDKLGSSDLEFSYKEIKQKYNVSESTLIAEILKELSSKDILKESGNTFHSGKLLAKGLEIKRNGGWLKTLELIEKAEENRKIKDEVELENLRYSTKLSKVQIKWFNVSLFVGFFGGLSGLVALFLQLYDPKTENRFEQRPVEKVDLKLNSDSISITNMKKDSLKRVE